jgi:hypothetical protein
MLFVYIMLCIGCPDARPLSRRWMWHNFIHVRTALVYHCPLTHLYLLTRFNSLIKVSLVLSRAAHPASKRGDGNLGITFQHGGGGVA